MTYKRIQVGRDHPLADSRGRALEHRAIWYDAGRELGPDDVLHHINGDPLDNRIENLQAMDRAAHSRLHAEQRRIERLRRRYAGWKVGPDWRPVFVGKSCA